MLSMLSGYGMDICRYMACPYGQQCMNGMCWPTGTSGVGGLSGNYGSYSGFGQGEYGYGFGGSETYNTGLASLGPVNPGSRYSIGPGLTGSKVCVISTDCQMGQNCVFGRCVYGTGITPVGGVQRCNMLQQCLNGQICANGFCTQSNIAYSGSQSQHYITTCSTGAPCPIGQYCINGMCIRDGYTSTFACSNGVCPTGMVCQFGRCIGSGFFG